MDPRGVEPLPPRCKRSALPLSYRPIELDATSQNRTDDTPGFDRVLYLLSYRDARPVRLGRCDAS